MSILKILQKGRYHKLKNLFDTHYKQINVNEIGDTTALISLILHDEYEYAKRLIDMGADINLSRYFHTTLSAVCRRGSYDMLKLILEHKDFDSVLNNRNITYSLFSCGDIKFIKHFINQTKHLNIDYKINQDDFQSVIRCLLKYDIELMKFFLKITDYPKNHEIGNIFIWLKPKNINIETVKYIVDLVILEYKHKTNTIQFVLETGSLELVKYAFEKIDIEFDNDWLENLYTYYTKNTLDILKYIVNISKEKNWNITYNEPPKKYNSNLLYYAIKYGSTDDVDFLVQQGLQINNIREAIIRNDLNLVKHLVNNHNYIVKESDIKDAIFTSYKMYKFLIKKNKIPYNQSLKYYFQNPYHYYKPGKLDIKILKSILLNDFKIETTDCMIYEVRKYDVEILQSLVDHGLNIYHTNDYGEDLFYFACRYYNMDMVNYLINAGININRLYHSRTVLFDTNSYMIKLLIDNGINRNIIDNDGNTAYMVCKRNYKRYLGLISELDMPKKRVLYKRYTEEISLIKDRMYTLKYYPYEDKLKKYFCNDLVGFILKYF